MVFDAAHFDQVAIQSPHDAAEVLVQSISELAAEYGLAVFGTEDNVVRELGKRSHRVLRSPLSRLGGTGARVPVGWRLEPLHPRLHAAAALAAQREVWPIPRTVLSHLRQGDFPLDDFLAEPGVVHCPS